jgi:hypothetical protein
MLKSAVWGVCMTGGGRDRASCPRRKRVIFIRRVDEMRERKETCACQSVVPRRTRLVPSPTITFVVFDPSTSPHRRCNTYPIHWMMAVRTKMDSVSMGSTWKSIHLLLTIWSVCKKRRYARAILSGL